MKKLILLSVIFIYGCFIIHAQNNPPVAVNDNYIPIFENWSLQFDTTISFNLVINDFDTDGDFLKIKEIYEIAYPDSVFVFNDSSFTLNLTGNSSIIERVFKYRICEVDNINSVSNWAYIDINPGMSLEAPVAKNDTFTVVPGYEFILNPLLNDYDPDGDEFYLPSCSVGQIISDSTVSVNIPWNDAYDLLYKRELNGISFISDTIPWSILFDPARIQLKIENVDFYDSLNINNVNALFNCFGNHFWDMPGGKGARFYVPNGATTTSLFSNSFWIGGLDENDDLHLAAERYRQVGTDYMHGPVSDVYDYQYDLRWFHTWKLNKTDIEYHQQNWGTAGYVCPDDILTWPGNGDVNNGQAQNLAPYYDINSNNVYEPMEGDYPIIKGDQELFFIFNDARFNHTETGGNPLGIEVQGSAYAFDLPEDSALWNTVFLHYDIINRSDTTYHNTYMGAFTDIDLGYGWDDFIGCDVQRGLYYGYNGLPEDQGGPEAYGENPPAMGVLFMGGPYLDSDDIDNPAGECDFSINGLNFGDTIVDNERLGMTEFIYFNNGGPAYQSDPGNAPEYYNYLRGIWKDNSQMLYGGKGHFSSGAVGPECKFMFPGDSDTCNWGTNGIPPEGGFNQNGYYWTEETAGNQPSDRRGLGASGPFTFEPGQVQQLDLAFVFGRNFDDTRMSSLDVMKQRSSYIKELYENNPDFFSKINQKLANDFSFYAYPNPANDQITIKGLPLNINVNYLIYDITGSVIKQGSFQSDNLQSISVIDMPKGIYIIKLTGSDFSKTCKFIKR